MRICASCWFIYILQLWCTVHTMLNFKIVYWNPHDFLESLDIFIRFSKMSLLFCCVTKCEMGLKYLMTHKKVPSDQTQCLFSTSYTEYIDKTGNKFDCRVEDGPEDWDYKTHNSNINPDNSEITTWRYSMQSLSHDLWFWMFMTNTNDKQGKEDFCGLLEWQE